MITEVSIRCQKTPEVGIRRIPAYTPPQYTTVCSNSSQCEAEVSIRQMGRFLGKLSSEMIFKIDLHLLIYSFNIRENRQ